MSRSFCPPARILHRRDALLLSYDECKDDGDCDADDDDADKDDVDVDGDGDDDVMYDEDGVDDA